MSLIEWQSTGAGKHLEGLEKRAIRQISFYFLLKFPRSPKFTFYYNYLKMIIFNYYISNLDAFPVYLQTIGIP